MSVLSYVVNYSVAKTAMLLLVGFCNLAQAAPLTVDADDDPWRRPRSNFVHWENPHVHPLDITPDQQHLLAVNTPDNSLMVFAISGRSLQLVATIPVGLDPVSVRARTNTEVWVVNHVSDSVSIVDLQQQRVTAVLQTQDEPADVVFAGSPQKAFVSISQQNRLNVFDPFNPGSPAQSIFINGEDPRALAVSSDGSTVYLAVFESGNGTTLLNGGKTSGCCEVDIVQDDRGPYGGIGIPPNAGDQYIPPINPAISLPTAAPLIVRKDDNNRWMDDNEGDWTRFVSGDLSSIGGTNRGRVQGWDYPDRDVAIIDADSHAVTYQHRLMNTNMALAVHPVTDEVTVVGTEATNEIRWEPNLKGTFVRVNLAKFSDSGASTVIDLNPHLDYTVRNINAAQRSQSIGDPRGIAWRSDGTRAYVTGMGSNNVVIIDEAGNRVSRIEVGQGPTGIVVQSNDATGFVLNKFDASISILNLNNNSEADRVGFYDPSPAVIKTGRTLLYDTHSTSGLGQVSCGSCHIDGRTDRLAWDLGDPSADMQSLVGSSATNSPVKGPMLTSTLQDVVGHKMLHWSGDRENLGDFDHAFVNLQGADSVPSVSEMLVFEAFLATIAIPPNPNRNLDNSFSTSVSIPGPNGTVARTGNAVTGAQQFENSCRACHRGDSTRGALLRNGGPFAIQHIRPPQWRNFHERYGLWFQSTDGSNAGFGFQQDGGFDSTHNGTRTNAMMAFMLSVNGRFPYLPNGLEEETESHDAHAAVGRQAMLGGVGSDSGTVDLLLLLADRGEIGLVTHARVGGINRGYTYIGNNQFQSDRLGERLSTTQLRNTVQSGATLMFTAVPAGSETRIGIDRDMDGAFNGDELTGNTDLSDPTDFPGIAQCLVTENVALDGQATQSSTYQGTQFPASLAIDGDTTNFSHTASGQTPANWILELDGSYSIDSVVLHNRDSCCSSRLRDLTLYVLDETGDKVAFRSPFINRHNQMNSPAVLSVDLVALTGAPVRGSQIRVVRTPDTLSTGINSGTSTDDVSVLSLAEVEVMACRSAAINLSPVVVNPGNQSTVSGSVVSLDIEASDPEQETVTFSASGLPAGLSIDPASGLISGTLQDSGLSTVSVAVSDGQSESVIEFDWSVVADNEPPVVITPSNQTGSVGETISLQLQASDPDDDELAFSATGLPSGLSINSINGLISGVLTTSGDYSPEVSVTDGEFNRSVTFNWQVTTANNCSAIDTIDPAVDSGIFVARDCTGIWSVVLTGLDSTGTVSTAGSVSSSTGFVSVMPVSTESSDSVTFDGLDRINFDMRTSHPWEDTFDFVVAEEADLCVDLTDVPAGYSVFAGDNRTPVTGAFNPATLASCTPPVTSCDPPSIQAASDRALFSWIDCAGDLHLVGAGAAAGARYAGHIYVDGEIAALSSRSLESSDTLSEITPQDALFDITMGGPWTDEIVLTPSSGSSMCVVVDLQSAGTSILAGKDRVSVTFPFDPATLQSCTPPTTGECGNLLIDASSEKGVFIWKDCADNWNMVFTGSPGAGGAQYSGSITSTAAFDTVESISLESTDSLGNGANGLLTFSVTTASPWEDSFGFSGPDAADLCITVGEKPDDVDLFFGVDRIPVTSPFNPETLAACQ